MNNRTVEWSFNSSGRYFLIDVDCITKEDVNQARNMLNNNDIQRAVKYLYPKDCQQCLLIYAETKKILGNLLGEEASQLSFSRNPFGKPYLADYPIHFNLSHSGCYAFLGVHPTCPIGVDIEKIREIALDSFLDPIEKKELSSHSPIQLWTAKEAYVKALGVGFSQAMPVLKPFHTNAPEGTSHFIAHTPQPFPPLLVKGFEKILTNYCLAICIHCPISS